MKNARLTPHLDAVFALSDEVRYVALYHHGDLAFRQRDDLAGASEGESDKYEELILNPTLLKAAAQRGNIDCGGLDYIVIRYGNFFQFVTPIAGGHLSVALQSDPISLASKILEAAKIIKETLN